MTRKIIFPLLSAVVVLAAASLPSGAASLGTKVLRGAAIGYAVKQSGGAINTLINKATLRNGMSSKYSTKVVPILSVGEKGYIGGAQVSGPASLVKKVEVVFQYEQEFDRGRYRIKALVPSSSINPLQLKRVEKVGVSAIIDVALDGGLKNNYYSGKLGTGELVRAAAVAVGIKTASKQLNTVINTITLNKGVSTKVVPMASFGEKAYIGGAQVSGSATTTSNVSAIWQYEDTFSNGKFRIKILVPTNSSNPLKMRRVEGVGVSAVIDTSIADQQEKWVHDRDNRSYKPTTSKTYKPSYKPGTDRSRNDDKKKQDNGKHKGWYKGKHKGWDKKADKDDRKDRIYQASEAERSKSDSLGDIQGILTDVLTNNR